MVKKKFCLVGIDNDFVDLIEDNQSKFVGYFSEKKRIYKFLKNRKKWLGKHNKENWYKIKKKYNPNVIITIDNSKIREKLFKDIYKKNCKNYFFKSSLISKSTQKKLKKKLGIVVQSHSKIMPNVNINSGVKIHIAVQIHHDCFIDEFATIAPKALLLGNVKIGKHAYVGANTTIKQKVKIGEGAIVGAGSVVVRNVKKYDVVAGVPAKSIKK